jgi:hypothetical protein
VRLLTETMQERLLEHFKEAASAKAFKAGDVAAGREYVKAYVEFIHYVERLYEDSTTGAHGHIEDAEPAAHSR